jgi:hypothetical protein
MNAARIAAAEPISNVLSIGSYSPTGDSGVGFDHQVSCTLMASKALRPRVIKLFQMPAQGLRAPLDGEEELITNIGGFSA